MLISRSWKRWEGTMDVCRSWSLRIITHIMSISTANMSVNRSRLTRSHNCQCRTWTYRTSVVLSRCDINYCFIWPEHAEVFNGTFCATFTSYFIFHLAICIRRTFSFVESLLAITYHNNAHITFIAASSTSIAGTSNATTETKTLHRTAVNWFISNVLDKNEIGMRWPTSWMLCSSRLFRQQRRSRRASNTYVVCDHVDITKLTSCYGTASQVHWIY